MIYSFKINYLCCELIKLSCSKSPILQCSVWRGSQGSQGLNSIVPCQLWLILRTAQHWFRPNPSSTLMMLHRQQNLNILNFTRINDFFLKNFNFVVSKLLQIFFPLFGLFFLWICTIIKKFTIFHNCFSNHSVKLHVKK
jgi:hypothetical protein